MNPSESLENDVQAIFFDGMPSSYDANEWKNILENFGHIRVFYISSKQASGYALFEKHQQAVEAAQNLDQIYWPEGSTNQINVQAISNEEMDSYIRLGIHQLQDVSILQPETAGTLFNITTTEPPIYWSFSKHHQ